MKNKLKVLILLVTAVVSIQAVTLISDKCIDLNNLYNYSDPAVPDYVFSEEVHSRTISDEISTLGRVLFYDKELSLNRSISCASCHKQSLAFGDTLVASPGFDKELTERHSTRLVNLNFSHMPEVFWDRRAGELDSLPLMVLSNSIEMGFSGENGQPTVDSLISRLSEVEYYRSLFEMAYGDQNVSVNKVNLALTQFVRSIVSYDSKYDLGRSMVEKPIDLFPNFTAEENFGKELFLSPFGEEIPEGAGQHGFFPDYLVVNRMGCADCHGIDNFTSRETSLTGNNGIIGVIGHRLEKDTTVLRSPSLRDLVNRTGREIGPYMHDGSLKDLGEVMEHYSKVGIFSRPTGLHTSLNIRTPNGNYNGPTGASGPSGVGPPPRLNQEGSDALVAFLKTLTGKNIYTDPKWSDPFSEDGKLSTSLDCSTLLTSYKEVEICEGESYRGFFTEGVHKKRISNLQGCDSMITINLKVKQMAERAIQKTICQGESFFDHTSAGSYVDIIGSDSACDTIQYLELEVIPYGYNFRREYFCRGDTLRGYTHPAVIVDTVPNPLTGCYNIVTTELRYENLKTTFETVRICEGDSYRGEFSEGYYRDTLDCYNILRFAIIFKDTIQTHLVESICEGDVYEGYDLSGSYTDVFKTEAGCDSLRILDLEVRPISETRLEKIICEGEVVEGYTLSGTYVDTYESRNGCDSTRTLDLLVHPMTFSSFEEEICRGDSFFGYSVSGYYVDRFTNSNGCDSIRALELTVLDHSESYIAKAICEGEQYEGYSSSGLYVDQLENADGCDSTRHIDLTILEHSESYNEASICDGDSYWGFDEAGEYLDVLTNLEGCDSSRHLVLRILEHSESNEEVHLCPGESFENYTEGYHSEYYFNSVGCDSTRHIHIVNIDSEDGICAPAYDEQPKLMSESNYLTAYPNPVQDFLKIRIAKMERLPAHLKIYDHNRLLVFEKELVDEISTIEFSEYSSGLYMVHVRDGLNLFLEKVVKIP